MASFKGYGIKGEQEYMADRYAVVNHEGSSAREKCSCGSWIRHWKKYTRKNADAPNPDCGYLNCKSKGDHGAHVRFAKVVKKPDGSLQITPQGASYIIPLCPNHNNPNHKGPFFVHKARLMILDSDRSKCEPTVLVRNKNNYYKMEVLSNSATPTCGCKTMYEHYRAVTKSSRVKCSALDCGADAIDAAPMKSVDERRDKDKWLAPLCRTHFRKSAIIDIKRPAELVRPGKAYCGR